MGTYRDYHKYNIFFICTPMNLVYFFLKIGVAKWSHVQQFYEIDNNNTNFVFAPALSEQHLNPNSKQKMRVAAGILSKIGNSKY